MPDIRSQICRLDDLLNSTNSGQSLPHEETKAIYGVEVVMYIQIFIFVKAAFFSEGIQQSNLIIKNPNKQSKTYFHVHETNEKSGNYCK